MLKLIALFRWSKALLLIGAALGALRLLHPGAAEALRHWARELPHAGQNRFILHALGTITHLPTQQVEWIAAALFAYAALFTVEGTGLWLGKRWGEWLTVIATTSFVPFEVYELARRATVLRGVLLAVNVAIVIYLIRRLSSRA